MSNVNVESLEYEEDRMPVAERRAEVIWSGNLLQGNGIVKVGSNALGTLPVTWASRTESPDGKTSPEELIAAAQASCFAMALSSTLAKAGTPSEQLSVNAVCTLDRLESGLKITAIDLDIYGQVPGISAEDFDAAVKKTEQTCPVTNALRNNVEVRVKAQLDTLQAGSAR